MLYVIPVFDQTYKSLHAHLPELTQVLIAISRFAREIWWLVLAVVGRVFLFQR